MKFSLGHILVVLSTLILITSSVPVAQEAQPQTDNEHFEYPEYNYDEYPAEALDANSERVAKTECPEGHFLYEGECYSEEDYSNPSDPDYYQY